MKKKNEICHNYLYWKWLFGSKFSECNGYITRKCISYIHSEHCDIGFHAFSVSKPNWVALRFRQNESKRSHLHLAQHANRLHAISCQKLCTFSSSSSSSSSWRFFECLFICPIFGVLECSRSQYLYIILNQNRVSHIVTITIYQPHKWEWWPYFFGLFL